MKFLALKIYPKNNYSVSCFPWKIHEFPPEIAPEFSPENYSDLGKATCSGQGEGHGPLSPPLSEQRHFTLEILQIFNASIHINT